MVELIDMPMMLLDGLGAYQITSTGKHEKKILQMGKSLYNCLNKSYCSVLHPVGDILPDSFGT